MIPQAYIIGWRNTHAPWESNAQVEQDLILSRLLIELFSHPELAKKLAFRGGTALQKLFVSPQARYSEDIDLVQVTAEDIGPTMSMLRSLFDPILGNAKWKQNQGRVTLIYRYESEIQPIEKMRIKIEINTREHFNVLGFKNEPFSVESAWFSGQTNITTYHLEELLGTKLRALHQRKKGRDLFDFHCFLQKDTGCDWEKVALCFTRYIEEEGTQITRAMFEKVLLEKLKEPLFTKDVNPLLSSKTIKLYKPEKTAVALMERVLPYLRGEPYRRNI